MCLPPKGPYFITPAPGPAFRELEKAPKDLPGLNSWITRLTIPASHAP
jgi:hypothetical protein